MNSVIKVRTSLFTKHSHTHSINIYTHTYTPYEKIIYIINTLTLTGNNYKYMYSVQWIKSSPKLSVPNQNIILLGTVPININVYHK